MLLALSLLAAAYACEAVTTPPEAFQVAWVSPMGKQVGPHAELEVVRVSDLRAWIRSHGADQLRVAQALGLVGRKAKAKEPGYKVTLFDVKREWLCRPMADGEPGAVLSSVHACEEGDVGPASGARKGFTGCGYSMDTNSSTRGLEVFRLEWEAAAAWGFCVMPLDRFLEGA